MKRILIILLGLFSVAYGQSSPTSSKTRFVNGIFLGTRPAASFNAADSNALFWRSDSSLMAKYKGTPRRVAFTDYVDSAKQSKFYINVEDYGAVGDGTTDDTDEILAAIAAAKAKQWGLAGTAGKTYVFSPTVESDITGIPFFRNLTLNMNGVIGDRTQTAPNSIAAAFKVTGERFLIDSNVVIPKDRRQMTLNAGLSIGTGDVLFITSLEAWMQPIFPYYYKGQRVVVNNYDTATGLTTIYGSFNEGINNAYVFKNTNTPRFEIEQSNFYTKNNNDLICFYIRFAEFEVDNSSFKNFGYATIALNSSEAQINGTRIYNPNNIGNGLSYGVAVWDLSKVFINNAHIEGGRHAVMGGGGGTWVAADMRPSQSGPAVFPGEYYINGGYYSTDSIQGNGALDAHANMWLASVKNVYTNDGLYLGAVNNIIQNVQVNAKKDYGITITHGSDTSSVAIISDAFVNVKSFGAPAFSTLEKMKYLSINNLNIIGSLNDNIQPINIADSIGTILIDGINVDLTNSVTQTNYATFRTWNDVSWKNININGISTQILPRRVGLNISLSNSSFTNSPWSYGLLLDGSSFKPATVTYENCLFTGNTLSGALVNTAGRLFVRNSFARDNGKNTGASNNLRSGVFAAAVDYVNFSGNDTRPQATAPTQTYGLSQTSGTSYKLINNDFGGNTVSPGYVVSGSAETMLANRGDANITNFLTSNLDIGTTNTAINVNFGASRAILGYDGANAIVQGGSGKGVWLNYNGANTALRVDPTTGNIGIPSAPESASRLLVNGTVRFTSRLTGTSLILNKDSLPITTSNNWALTVDTPTGRINRINIYSQILGNGGGNIIPKYNGTSGLTPSNLSDNGTLITLGSNSFVNGALGVGSTTLTGYNFRVNRTMTGASSFFGVHNQGAVQSDVTNAYGYTNVAQTQATSFTLLNYFHYLATQSTLGAGSAITNQYGYFVDATLVGAANNFAFRGAIPSGANRWNLFMDGAANNYLNGRTLFGTTTDDGSTRMQVSGAIIASLGIRAQRGNFTSLVLNKDSVPISTTNIWGITLDTSTNRINRTNLSNVLVSSITFDTTTRVLSIPTLAGGSSSVVIPRGTASGTSVIVALSSSRTGNLVTVSGDNGSTTTFSIRDADSTTRANLIAGNGLSGSSYNGVTAQTWTADTTVLSTKNNVTALLLGYSPTSSLGSYAFRSTGLAELTGANFTGNVGFGVASPISKIDVLGGGIRTLWESGQTGDNVISGINGISNGFRAVVSSGNAITYTFHNGDNTAVLQLANSGAATYSSSVTASSFIRSGGTSTQYLMADGSVTTANAGSSGTYTPTITGVSNVAASTSNQAQYMRVGNVVTVSGYIEVDPTSGNTPTQFRISLPVSTSWGSGTSKAGGVMAGIDGDAVGTIYADPATDTVTFRYTSSATASNMGITFTFTYLIE